TDDMQGTKRLKGYLKAHRHYGIPINKQNIITYTTEEKVTRPAKILDEILSSSVDPRAAIGCDHDELAITLLDVRRNQKIQIPEEISIVGFDHSFVAEVTEVKLTSIKHPKMELGEMAAKKIIDLIHYKEGKQDQEKNDLFESYIFQPE